MVDWVWKTASIQGKSTFSRRVEVPSGWKQHAVNITASKYLNGSDPTSPEYEDSFKHLFDRIANTYTIWGWREGYFETRADAKAFNADMKFLLVFQMWAPNSPVWFNIGLSEQWRWGRPDLLSSTKPNAFHQFDDGEIRAVCGMEYPQTSACFLSGVEDSMEGILHHQLVEGKIFASGSGVGVNLSDLRAEGEKISGKGNSSGPLAFNAGWDKMAGAIKSGGKTRRAARMVRMDNTHPDIFKFVNYKHAQEDVAKIILNEHNLLTETKNHISQNQSFPKTSVNSIEDASRIIAESAILGLPQTNHTIYASDMDSFLFADVISGQNANLSVGLDGSFWDAAQSGTHCVTHGVTDKSVSTEYRPEDLMAAIGNAIWASGDPGIHFDDTINLWNPAKSDGKIKISNPCSEYFHLVGTSCNLSTLNLAAFCNTKDSRSPCLNLPALRAASKIAVVAADLNIACSGFPDPQFAKSAKEYRTIGVGWGNVGGTLMAAGIPYDSNAGRLFAADATACLTAACYETSAKLGEALGAYGRADSVGTDHRRILGLHGAFAATLPRLALNLRDGATTEETTAGIIEDAEKHIAEWGDAENHTAEWLNAVRKFASCFDEADEGGGAVDYRSLSGWEMWANISADAVYRNNFVSLFAPGGTISAPLGIFDDGTTSIEPEYSLLKHKALAGGGFITMVNTTFIDGLRALGYSEHQIQVAVATVGGIEALSSYCTDEAVVEKVLSSMGETEIGVGHLGGLSWLLPAHNKVFDCAVPPKGGSGHISYLGHIRMLGAVQPFISGAASKTVNVPASFTPKEIEDVVVRAYYSGVKCVAIYRDGSKGASVFFDPDENRSLSRPEVLLSRLSGDLQDRLADFLKVASVPKRKKLPGKRNGEIVKFEINGQLDGFFITGRYPNGTIGEIFGELGQLGSFPSGMFKAFTKAISVMLQWGIPPQNIISTFRNTAFEPSGFVRVANGDSGIKSCRSIVDLTCRILEELIGESAVDSPIPPHPSHSPTITELSSAEVCSQCGQLSIIQDGKCKRCSSCGWSGGGCGG